MKLRRPVLLRTAGFMTLAALVGLNGWLLVLNLAKHDRLPTPFDRIPGVATAANEGLAAEGDRADDSGGESVDGEAAAFAAEDTIVAGSGQPGTIEVDQWPGGRGPVPDGEAAGRRIHLLADGRVRLTGSAPTWSVVTDLVEALGRRPGIDPLRIDVDIVWHPDASPRLADGEVVLDAPLIYRPGQIELSEDAIESLAPVISLVAENPELYVVVVGLVDDADVDASDEVAAVALGRTSVVAEVLADGGIESERVVTSVAPVEASDAAEATGDRVLVRVENLLVFGPSG